MSDENTETMSRFTTSDIFNTNKLSTDEIIRIGKDYANIDTWHGNQYFTTMLLVGEIERLKEEVEKAYQKGVRHSHRISVQRPGSQDRHRVHQPGSPHGGVGGAAALPGA